MGLSNWSSFSRDIPQVIDDVPGRRQVFALSYKRYNVCALLNSKDKKGNYSNKFKVHYMSA